MSKLTILNMLTVYLDALITMLLKPLGKKAKGQAAFCIHSNKMYDPIKHKKFNSEN